jgi:hypothetical protein
MAAFLWHGIKAKRSGAEIVCPARDFGCTERDSELRRG